jgi:integrase
MILVAIVAADKSKRPEQRLSGAARADLYAILAGTGLRIGAVGQLLMSDLQLTAIVPGIDLRPEVTKSRKAAFIPLRNDLLEIVKRRAAG